MAGCGGEGVAVATADLSVNTSASKGSPLSGTSVDWRSALSAALLGEATPPRSLADFHPQWPTQALQSLSVSPSLSKSSASTATVTIMRYVPGSAQVLYVQSQLYGKTPASGGLATPKFEAL